MPEALAYQEDKLQILVGESEDGRVTVSVRDPASGFVLTMTDPVVIWLIKALQQTRAIVEDRKAAGQFKDLTQKG